MINSFLNLKEPEIIWDQDIPSSKLYKDIYSSKNEEIEESKYVFIKANNLIERWEKLKDNEIL